MSKYIPGNQKHLTLEDRVYIENEFKKKERIKEVQELEQEKKYLTAENEGRPHRLQKQEIIYSI